MITVITAITAKRYSGINGSTTGCLLTATAAISLSMAAAVSSSVPAVNSVEIYPSPLPEMEP